MEFQVRYLVLFRLFSLIGGFKWSWIKSLHKSIQLMMEFPKAPFLVLHFPYYILMTLLIMLSVILLSVLMILLSTVGVIRHLISLNNYSWLVNLNLIYKTLCGLNWLVDFNAGKTQLVLLAGLVTLVLLMWKWMGLFLRKNHPVGCWRFLSLLTWIEVLILSLLLKLLSRKLEPWLVLWSFFLLRLLCISINLPYGL